MPRQQRLLREGALEVTHDYGFQPHLVPILILLEPLGLLEQREIMLAALVVRRKRTLLVEEAVVRQRVVRLMACPVATV